VKDYILRYIDLFVLCGIRKNCHSSGRKLLFYQFIERVIKLTAIIIEAFSFSQLPKILSDFLLDSVTPYINEIVGIISVGSVVINLLPIRFPIFARYRRKNESISGQCLTYL